MSRRKKKQQQQDESASWIVTFSDLMTLLLTFFILLFSMSSISNEKFQQAAYSLSTSLMGGGTGILDGVIVPPDTVRTEVNPKKLDPELMEMYERVKLFIEENSLEEQVSLSADTKGIYVNMDNAILFGVESSSISREGQKLLDSLAKMINQMDNRIIIEGYTDNIPTVYGQYETNWELSSSRAVAVLRYLNEEQNVDPYRLSAIGYGAYRPLVPNDTSENRSKNRRVNIVVVYEKEE